MNRFKLIGLTLVALTLSSPAMAAFCPDLWFERNAIYDENGFCFKTEKGKATFDNSDCWTSKPKFSKSEWNRIKAIKRQEKLEGCTAGGNSAPG
jgi:YARHG domain